MEGEPLVEPVETDQRRTVELLDASAQIGDHVFGLGDCGAEFCLALLVAVDDGTAEFAGLAVDVIEELLTLRSLGNLVSCEESDADADDEPQCAFHCNLLK
jgi:hypothetical protein